jgi:tetratricopeptide (TPR) repeat protein
MARSDDLQRQLGELERGAALRHVASAMAELGQPTRALEIIGEITGLYDRTAVQMSAAMALAEKGDAAEALKTAKVIESQRYQAVILGRIAVIQARAGDLAAADETIDEALDSTEQIKMSYAKSYAIGQLAQALVEIGVETGRDALAEAVKTAMEIENDRLRAYTLWTAAAAQRRKGFAAAARKTEALATEATEEIVSSLSQVWLYGDLASENAEAGQKAMAMAAFRKGIAIAESIHNAWGRARALAKLATALGDIQ